MTIKTKKEVAEDHEAAAGYHYAILDYIEEHPNERDEVVKIYGDEEWHKHWYEVHLDAVYWIRRPFRHTD